MNANQERAIRMLEKMKTTDPAQYKRVKKMHAEMDRRAKCSPWEIEIELYSYDGVFELRLVAALWPNEETPYTCAEVVAGRMWVAGVIARLGLALGSRMRDPALHGLGDDLTPVRIPDVYGSDDLMVELADGPSVEIEVPQADAKRWLAIAKSMLARLLAADAADCPCTECKQLAGEDSPADPASSSASCTTSHTATPPAPERIRP